MMAYQTRESLSEFPAALQFHETLVISEGFLVVGPGHMVGIGHEDPGHLAGHPASQRVACPIIVQCR
jgi:hypothetical protein